VEPVATSAATDGPTAVEQEVLSCDGCGDPYPAASIITVPTGDDGIPRKFCRDCLEALAVTDEEAKAALGRLRDLPPEGCCECGKGPPEVELMQIPAPEGQEGTRGVCRGCIGLLASKGDVRAASAGIDLEPGRKKSSRKKLAGGLD
jgi:hypothetical protein